MFLTDNGEVLLLRRGAGGDWPGAFAFPGGKEEPEDKGDLEKTATRETKEEIGFLPTGDRAVLCRRISLNQDTLPPDEPVNMVPPQGEPVDYTTFLQRVPSTFQVELSDEHTAYLWMKPAEALTAGVVLHPGAVVALNRLAMDELGVARAMAAGDLTSPQRYQNVWLFAMRITGTGLAYRSGRQEFAWRESSIYLNDDFLARCNGLSVIWEHPEKDILDSAEYSDRVIGAIFLPYIKGEDVWGIAKIYDDEAAYEMENNQLSTSPSVVMRGGEKFKMEDGRSLLVEGVPHLLDHLAVCKAGVWDKKGPPNGIDTTGVSPELIGVTAMADNDVAADADAGVKLDKLLSGVDSMMKRMDAQDARMDAMEEEKKADSKRRADAEAAEAAKRADEEEDSEEKRKERADAASTSCADDDNDAGFSARMDAEEEDERKKREEKGEAKEVAADKSKKHRADKEKWRADRRADAKRRSDEDEKKRADAVRNDSQAIDARVQQILKDGGYIRAEAPETIEDRDAKLSAQSRADSVYRALAIGPAPEAMQAESVLGYRKRLAKTLQKHSKKWHGSDIGSMIPDIFAIAEGDIFNDAGVEARNPISLPDDRLVQVIKVDPVTGLRSFEYRGKRTFIAGMKAPSMRVTGIQPRQLARD